MLTLDEFSELVSHIYDGALDEALWPDILQRLVHATGAVGGALLTSDFSRRELMAVHIGFDPAARLSYNQYYGGIDPVAPILERALPGNIVLSHQVVPPSEQDTTEFYPDWARPAGFGLTAFATLLRDDNAVSTLCLCGPLRPNKAFDAAEISSFLLRIAPHLRKALRISMKAQIKEAQRQGMLAALAHVQHGVVLLDENRQVLFANDAAERIIRRADGLMIAQGRLCTTNGSQNTRLQRLADLAIGRNRSAIRSGGTMAVRRSLSNTPLALHVTPLGNTRASEGHKECALLCIVDAEDEPRLSPSHLQRLYGLTDAEAAVAVRIIRGHKLQDVADELNVTLSTVRIQLQRVFDKTHTHRQTQLVRLLLGIANAFSATDRYDA